jgi:hypothetical protein
VQLFRPLTITGYFDASISRHLIAPLEDWQDDKVREENLLKPVRGAGTLIADIVLPWTIVHAPGPFRWIFQDDLAARDQAELRTWPILEAIPEVVTMMPANRNQHRTQQIIFRGMPLHIGGPALGQLQSRGWQYMVVDEPWQYRAGRLEEIRGRMGDFQKMGTEKMLCISQGGEEGGDWDRQYQRGIIHEWSIECARCGHFQVPRWTGYRPDGSLYGMRWDPHRTESGEWDIPKCLPSVRWECEKCGHPHLDCARTKTEWNRTGKYIAETTEKLPKRRSRHWNSVIDFPWVELVDMYLQALNAWKRGVVEPLIQFCQKRLAEMKTERSLMEGTRNFSRATYEVNSKWPDEIWRCMTSDRQELDVFWYQIRAWSKSAESHRIACGKAFSFAELETIREKHKVPPNLHLIDSKFQPKGDHGVYAACRRYGWLAVRGTAKEGGGPITFFHSRKKGPPVQKSYIVGKGDPESGSGGGSRGPVDVITFSGPTMADRLARLIDLGLWMEPAGIEDDPEEIEYRRQMSSEFKKKRLNKFTGRWELVWVCPSGNNHQWDCAKQQVLAATVLGPIPDELEEPKEKEEESVLTPAPT